MQTITNLRELALGGTFAECFEALVTEPSAGLFKFEIPRDVHYDVKLCTNFRGTLSSTLSTCSVTGTKQSQSVTKFRGTKIIQKQIKRNNKTKTPRGTK